MMWDWQELKTMSGDASGVPAVLQQLLHGTYEQRSDAFRALYGKVVNQGDLYTSAAAVTDVILDELRSREYLPDCGWLMLHEIFRSFGCNERIVVNGCAIEIEEYCRGRMLDALPIIENAVANLLGKDFDYAAFLLGDMGEFSNQAIAILEREALRSTGSRLQSARDQLEVAIELAQERKLDNGKGSADLDL
ncbi:hypothetical protein AB0D67_04520 [Streptosporangium sp. NPDC048047]|uniref:hypothetical protein n=1 Tax=Streptosporangium sp. NPDC048047 TaxID=3155748 RepID=UPI003436E2D6